MKKRILMGQGYCPRCLGATDSSGFCKNCADKSVKAMFKKLQEHKSEKTITKKEFSFDDVENQLKGYKYMVGLTINTEDPLAFKSGEDRLCICETRDECIEEIKKEIARYEEANKRDNFILNHDNYNITRLGTIIKWHDEKGTTWFWTFGIYPIRYVENNTNKK